MLVTKHLKATLILIVFLLNDHSVVCVIYLPGQNRVDWVKGSKTSGRHGLRLLPKVLQNKYNADSRALGMTGYIQVALNSTIDTHSDNNYCVIPIYQIWPTLLNALNILSYWTLKIR